LRCESVFTKQEEAIMKTLGTFVILIAAFCLLAGCAHNAKPAPPQKCALGRPLVQVDVTWWVNKALTCAEKAPSDSQKETMIAAVAEVQAQAGMFTEAVNNANTIKDKDKRDTLLRVIGEQQANYHRPADAGQIDAAITKIKEQQDGGDKSEAIENTRENKDPYLMSLEYARIAVEEAKQGKVNDAIRDASSAFGGALTLADTEHKMQILQECATAQITAGSITAPAETLNLLMRLETNTVIGWYCIYVLRAMTANAHPDRQIYWTFSER